MTAQLRPALVVFALLTLLTGVAYPLLVTGIAQEVFPRQAGGSVLVVGGRAVGSRLIGQPFDAPGLFWSRPSATAAVPYDAWASAGSNLGPTNPALVAVVRQRMEALRAADPEPLAPVPVDLVTASASGLDPEISMAGALFQVGRVARHQGLPTEEVHQLVLRHAEGRSWGFLGEPRVNVLELNLDVERLVQERRARGARPTTGRSARQRSFGATAEQGTATTSPARTGSGE